MARHNPEDNLFDKLTKLLKLASEGKIHPAGDGKSEGKQQVCDLKLEPLPDPPTKLFAQHWAGKLMTVSDVANRVHVPNAGEHITFGILPEMPSPATLQLLRPSDSGTVTFVLSKKPDSHESVEVRAPAGTLRGTTRITKLYVVQFGEARAPTAWQADKVTTVIKPGFRFLSAMGKNLQKHLPNLPGPAAPGRS